MNFISEAFLFLIQTLFNLYLFVVILRLILQWRRADFYNPVSQFVIKLTNPVVMPLRRFFSPIKRFDTATFVLLMVLEFLKLFIVIFVKAGVFPGLLGLLLWSVGDLLDLVITIYFYAILVVVILSWLNPMGQNPVLIVLYLITDPLLEPARRLIPLIAGLDLSPIFALILLKVAEILLIQPLMQLGISLAIRSYI